MKYDKQKYLDYLRSADWLIKKSRLVMFYLRNKIPIDCSLCGSVNNLQVHHRTYKRLYKEKNADLDFLCKDCHHLSYINKTEFKRREVELFDQLIDFFNRTFDGKE